MVYDGDSYYTISIGRRPVCENPVHESNPPAKRSRLWIKGSLRDIRVQAADRLQSSNRPDNVEQITPIATFLQ